MVSAYYSYSESKITVFDNKAISKRKNWNKYLGKFYVIQLNMCQVEWFGLKITRSTQRLNYNLKKIRK